MPPLSIRNTRLYNQLLTHKPFTEPGEILSHFGAIQAQDYSGAKWSIGARLSGATDSDIENALINKSILRTWLMRGTLFFVKSDDLRWMQQLVAPKIIASLKRRHAELELDTDTLLRTSHFLTEALAKSPLLSRKELMSIIQRNGISTEGSRSYHILLYAALNGLICQTNSVKSMPNYILTDRIEAHRSPSTREEAIAELTRRYFTSRGPATIYDFAWWSGLTIKEIKIGLEANKKGIISETFNGQTYWFSENSNAIPAEPNVQMLPGFDEFLLGYKDRTVSLQTQFNTLWCPGNNGMFMPFVVKNGEVIGIWKRINGNSAKNIEITYFTKSGKLAAQAYSAAAQKIMFYFQKI